MKNIKSTETRSTPLPLQAKKAQDHTPIHMKVSTQEGADILGIPRLTFIQLLEDKVIPYRLIGNRKLVKAKDMQAYKQRIDLERLNVLKELSALDQEMGMGYD